jgi:hypothetical protein
MTVAKKQAKKPNGNGANLGLEQTLWLAAELGKLSPEDRQRLAAMLIGH